MNYMEFLKKSILDYYKNKNKYELEDYLYFIQLAFPHIEYKHIISDWEYQISTIRRIK